MNSSGMIALFDEPGESTQNPFSFLFSVVAHCGVIGLVSLGVIYAPKIKEPPLGPRYTMRLLELHMVADEMHAAVSDPELQAPIDLKQPSAPAHKGEAPAKLPSKAEELAAAPQPKPAPETLVLPDLPKNLVLPVKVPLPSVVLAAPKDSPSKTIVPPPPVKAVAMNKPVLDLSNREAKLADVKISSTAFATEKLPLLPSSTSPIVVRGPSPIQKAPETASNSSQQPTAARVMSMSDMHMKDGVVALPRANMLASGNGQQGSSQNGAANVNVHSQRTSAGTGSSNESGSGTNRASGQGSGSSGPGTRHIALPKNGKFGMVVVGASIEEEYPESAGIWNGRLAYTVYLHVGLAKSWILQYSQTRAAQAAATGSAPHLEAPWPTDMVIPNLAPDSLNSDALMVHGVLNKAGRFENLSIAFPPQFPLTRFVLDALQQWQFRPATADGQVAAVEVLLIIPDQHD